ncbi:MAG: response regulator [Helicobacteraceae bacterium]|nr:response regulator [Helicobacteraceae bacterium]
MRTILKEYNILYAEDEPEVQKNIAEYLETYFKNVYLADDGQEAQLLYNKHKPEVILLDISLPFLDGLTLAKRIRAEDENVKILMLSAHTEQDKLLKAIELKLVKYLVKPVKPSEFKDALDKLANEIVSFSPTSLKLDSNTYWMKKERVLKYKDEEISLTQKEKKLLELLVEHRGKCVTHEDIMAIVWEENFEEEISKASVKSQMNYLRKKLPENVIESIYSKGYSLRV